MRVPNRLFRAPIERATLDPDNVKVVEQHAACASHEQPLVVASDIRLLGRRLPQVARELVQKGILGRNSKVHFVGRAGAWFVGKMCVYLNHWQLVVLERLRASTRLWKVQAMYFGNVDT